MTKVLTNSKWCDKMKEPNELNAASTMGVLFLSWDSSVYFCIDFEFVKNANSTSMYR